MSPLKARMTHSIPYQPAQLIHKVSPRRFTGWRIWVTLLEVCFGMFLELVSGPQPELALLARSGLSGFVWLAHIQKLWGLQLIRSRLSSGEFAERVCYWILGVGGKAVRLSFLMCGLTGSNMTVIQQPSNH